MISAPSHVQDFPARYSPQMGFEGANVLFDTWVHPLVMGLEEHLLTMFRDDFEFSDAAGPSHLGAGHAAPSVEPQPEAATPGPLPTSFGPARRKPNSLKSPSSCAERRAATPRPSPPTRGWP